LKLNGLEDSLLFQEQHESLREICDVQEVIEQREYLLGTDMKGNTYLHFPQFCGPDLRIYRQSTLPFPKMEKRESIEQKEEVRIRILVCYLFDFGNFVLQYLELVRGSRSKRGRRRGGSQRRIPRSASSTPQKEVSRPRDSRLRQVNFIFII
jgi:hypothetical protein